MTVSKAAIAKTAPANTAPANTAPAKPIAAKMPVNRNATKPAISKSANNKDAMADPAKAGKEPWEASEAATLQLGELSELLGYAMKRAQLKVFEDFLRCVAPLQLTPAQFSVLLLLDRNPGRNQTEIANTLGILRPNFVSMLDGLESRGLCERVRSASDRRSHILLLTD
jgi:DNA-binding MarR family transcriptional regulator